ncbi:hypothetical protein ACHAQJ_001328 [Trichoderma viride]
MKPVLASANLASASRTQHLMMMRNISATFNLRNHYQRNQAIFNGHSTLRNFSIQAPLRNQQQKNDELPSFSFEGLGMSRNVKIFIIGVLSIFGTIETWVWCKGIYRWWNGPSEKEKKQAEASQN